MSDFGASPDGDEVSMLTLSTDELGDVLLGQPKNDIKVMDDYADSEFPERKHLREVNGDEASLFTLDTNMVRGTIRELNIEAEDQDDISEYKASEYQKTPRVNPENLEGRNGLETRVHKSEKSRSKYKCGKCGKVIK